MFKKLNWRIVALIVFVLAAGGFIYWQLSSVQQLKQELAQDGSSLEGSDEPEVQHVVSFGDQKPPDEQGFEWVRHGDHWDKVPVTQSDMLTVQQEDKMSPDFLDKLRKQAGKEFYQQIRGVDRPPPDGYKYRIDASGKAIRDGDGNPILHKIGEPLFTIGTQRGFAPNREQFQMYRSMEQDRLEAIRSGQYAKAEEIQASINDLRKQCQGDLPSVSVSFSPDEITPQEVTQRVKHRLYEEYRVQGFEHLIPEEYK